MGKSNKKMLSRIERIQLKVRKQEREKTLQKALTQHTTIKKSVSGWIKRLPVDRLPAKRLKGTPAGVLTALYNRFPAKDTLKQTAFQRLLFQLEKQNCFKLLSIEKYLNGLFKIASYASYFIRDVKEWKRQSYQPDKQFSHLLRFMFARYEVPLFMDTAWLSDADTKSLQWFIAIANGESVRKLNHLPVVLTKRMAHAFLQAPAYCSVAGAFRYAQVIALGGDEWIAWHINGTLLGRNGFRDDDFWITVMCLFVKATLFDLRRLNDVIDYIHHQRMVQNTYCIKGRTPESLLRQTEAWRIQMNLERNTGGLLSWKSSGIEVFDYETGSGHTLKIYKIRELLSSNELQAEGKYMGHCVYTYARSCFGGKCAIFSLMVYTITSSERLATIEVDLKQGKIMQAKARFNDAPLEEAREIIRKWAATVPLRLSKYLF